MSTVSTCFPFTFTKDTEYSLILEIRPTTRFQIKHTRTQEPQDRKRELAKRRKRNNPSKYYGPKH